MKTKAKSVHIFVVSLWSKKHFTRKGTFSKRAHKVYDGWITNVKSNKQVAIHSPAQLLNAIEEMYKKEEKKIRRVRQ